MKGFVAGMLGLIALQAVLNLEERGRYRPSGLLKLAGDGLRRALDPNVPAIGDRRQPPAPARAARQSIAGAATRQRIGTAGTGGTAVRRRIG